MSVTSTPKVDVAAEMLERSIELFLRGDSFHSSLHLAGCAEELLNVYVRHVDLPGGELTPNFDEVKAMLVDALAPKTEREKFMAEKWAYDRLVDPKNSVKHMRGSSDLNFVYDAEKEAEDVILRAVITYTQLRRRVNRPIAHLVAAFYRATVGCDPA